MNLKDKVALVTGASGGLGSAIAIDLASRGCDIIIHYNSNKDAAFKVQKELDNFGSKSLVIKADISDEIQVKSMFEKILNNFDRLDIVVNNAAIAEDSDLNQKSIDSFRNVIDVNLTGTFIVSKIASRYMQTGSIINIASNNIYDQGLYSVDYDASKAGVVSLTHSLAKIMPSIRINAIAPGWINTKPVLSMNPDLIKQETEKIIMHRFGEPKEIAKVVTFLASDDASYITDTVIRVDGGRK